MHAVNKGLDLEAQQAKQRAKLNANKRHNDRGDADDDNELAQMMKKALPICAACLCVTFIIFAFIAALLYITKESKK